jgi:hypothetical protein
MKTKYILFALLTVFLNLAGIYTSHSQVIISLLFGEKLNSESVKFGLDGGVNFADLGNVDPSDSKANFNLGFYFDILIQENTNWYLHTGVLVKSPMGSKGLDVYSLDDPGLDSVFAGGTIDRQLRYFNVPLLVRYKFGNQFFIEAGPMLGLLSKANDVFYNEVNEEEDLSFRNKVTDQYKRFDAGIQAGVGYHLMKGTGMNFGVRYYQGFMDIMKDNAGNPMKNQSWYLFASIPIGAGEKAKAKAAAKESQIQEKKK